WHNSAYRRDLLVAMGEQLDFLLTADTLIQATLLEQGHRLTMAPAAATRHCNASLPMPHWVALFWGNRLFGATRAIREKWSVPRRLMYALAFPAIAILRFRRGLKICFAVRGRKPPYVRLLPALLASSCVAAAGEAVGYIFGLGGTLRRRSYYE